MQNIYTKYASLGNEILAFYGRCLLNRGELKDKCDCALKKIRNSERINSSLYK